MGDVFKLSKTQMARILPHSSDARRFAGGIIYIIRNGLQWKDAPKA